jgi:hypothetical protein
MQQTKLDWRMTTPPVRAATVAAAAAEGVPAPLTQTVRTLAPGPEVNECAELIALARTSAEACAGLGTLNAVIVRVDQTRALLHAWQRLGPYLHKKRISPSESAELGRVLTTISEVTDEYPPFVGHPGKPGYRIVALARLAMTFEMFRSMQSSQRQELRRDWEAGQTLLLEHRRYLRRQFKAMRSHSKIALVLRAIRSALNDHALLFGAATVAVIALVIVLRLWLF